MPPVTVGGGNCGGQGFPGSAWERLQGRAAGGKSLTVTRRRSIRSGGWRRGVKFHHSIVARMDRPTANPRRPQVQASDRDLGLRRRRGKAVGCLTGKWYPKRTRPGQPRTAQIGEPERRPDCARLPLWACRRPSRWHSNHRSLSRGAGSGRSGRTSRYVSGPLTGFSRRQQGWEQ